MSLLDDARRLAAIPLDDSCLEEDACPFCLRCGGHDDDCPWLSMPKIVAALEAAERLLEQTGPIQHVVPARIICRVCHSEGPDWEHTDRCAWNLARQASDA